MQTHCPDKILPLFRCYRTPKKRYGLRLSFEANLFNHSCPLLSTSAALLFGTYGSRGFSISAINRSAAASSMYIVLKNVSVAIFSPPFFYLKISHHFLH